MRIDAHQHFWKYRADEYGWIDDSMSALRRDFLPADLEPELKRAGFGRCVAVQAQHSVNETEWLLDLADQNPFIAGVVGWVDLCAEDAREHLARLANHPKLLGIRHVVQGEPDDRFLLRPDFLRGIGQLQQFDLTYDILIYPKHLPVAAEFVQRFPAQRFVLDHLAKPFIKKGELEPWVSDLRRLASHSNVFCKLSGMVTEADWKAWKPEHFVPYLETALECFGPNRLMIGSDWPVCLVAANSYGDVMDMVQNFLTRYSGDVAGQILGGTAQRFWRL
jgi:L-fucono-1,5-lactonase